MRFLLTTLLLVTTIGVFSQETFSYQKDFKTILARTKDKNDSLAYDKLLTRFTAGDKELTDFEVLALLIGFTDKPDYKPYDDITTEREIFDLNGKDKYEEGLTLGKKFLQTHPLSLKALYEVAYSYYKLGQKDSLDSYAYRGNRIIFAMHFSGNGLTKETPMFALGPADGQDYIHKTLHADIGTMGSGSDKDNNFLDILEAKLKDGKTVTFYFIIQHATNKMFGGKSVEEMLKEQEQKNKKPATEQ